MDRSFTEILESRVEIPQHTVVRRFPDQTVAFDVRTGSYHGLDPASGHMLEVVAQSRRVRGAVETLASHSGRSFEETAAALCDLCVRLDARGLITLRSGS